MKGIEYIDNKKEFGFAEMSEDENENDSKK